MRRAGGEAESSGPTTRDRRLARVEAVLLVAREPLSSRRLAALANLADGTEARTLVHRLGQMYERSATAFRVDEVAGGFQLLSQPKYSPWLRRVCGAPAEVRLSAPALETLAVVAYRQPVLRVDIEAVRGVQCGEILRQLLERDLVRIAGRSEELGRPFLYGTTRQFLQLFGLRNLESLPRVELFRSMDENATTDNSEADHRQEMDAIGESEVSIAIDSLGVLAELGERRKTNETPISAMVITDDHGEFEDDEDEEDDDDDDDDYDDEYGDLDDEEDDEEEEEEDDDLEDADWEEVDGDDDDLDEDDDEDEEEDDDEEDWDDFDEEDEDAEEEEVE